MYLTTGEAAKRCGVKLNTIKNWIRNGDISAIQTPGGHWRIPQAPFALFMKKFNAHVRQPNSDVLVAKKRILVIDDDISAHELVLGALEMYCPNYEVYSAYDGYSGLIEIGRLQPDLILLDIMMPDINGLEIIQRLKAKNTPLPNANIIAITAASDKRLVVNRIHKTNIEGVFFKPLNINALIHSVQSVLGHTDKTVDAGLGI